jgi:hypothetical protein
LFVTNRRLCGILDAQGDQVLVPLDVLDTNNAAVQYCIVFDLALMELKKRLSGPLGESQHAEKHLCSAE